MLSTWNKALLSLALLPGSVWAQDQRRDGGTWQHADGLFMSWQRARADASEQTFYLVDDGNLQLARSDVGRSRGLQLDWTLGLGESLDRFARLSGRTFWERSMGQHRLSLALDAGGSAYYGSTRFADLEEQFILTNALSRDETEGTTHRWGTTVAIGDVIALTRTLDVTVDANRRESNARISGVDQGRSTFDSWGARLEKRWQIARLQASTRKTELEINDDLALRTATVRQNVLDMQARLLFPLLGRLNGSVGWQDLSSSGTDAAQRRLSGPEVGLTYTPLSAWNASLFVRSLREDGAEDSDEQIFGEGLLAFRSNAQNEFILTASRQIDLVSSFRAFNEQNAVATDQQRSTVATQLQWSYQKGRYRSELRLSRTRQEFAESHSEFIESNWNQIFEATRRGRLNLDLIGRKSQFDTDEPPLAIKRTVLDLRAGWQEILTGGWRPLGARSYYRVDAVYENLLEQITAVRAERLTILVSYGQLGNF